MTFVSYKNLFDHVSKSGLILPLSYLNSDANVDNVIHDLIDDFECVEAISYSSFLNAMVQTYKADDTQKLGWKELQHCKLVKGNENEGIVFHRDNLLHLIGQLIDKEKAGVKKITGQKTFGNAADFYKSLLLINGKGVFHPPSTLTEQILLKDTFLRAYPYYYLPHIVEQIYRIRLQRYWHIYHDLINKLEAKEVDKIKVGLKKITDSYKLSLNQYFHVLVGVFGWFLQSQALKNADPSNDQAKKLGFNHKNLESFYVRRHNFGDGHDTFSLIGHLSKDLSELKRSLKKKRKDPPEWIL